MRDLGIADERYFRHAMRSVFACLYGELAIRYSMTEMKMEKFSLANRLPAHDPSFCQITEHSMFICGGLKRGVKHQLSDYAGIFDYDTNTLHSLQLMPSPKYRHCVVGVGSFVFSLGGSVQHGIESKVCERYDLNAKTWSSIASMHLDRVLPKACVSFASHLLYVFVGAVQKQDNCMIERYQIGRDMWSTLKVKLPEPFKNTLSFCVMISGGVHIN